MDYFRACGIGDDAFAKFSDDRQIADEELGVIRRIAVRLRDCPIDRLQRMTPPETAAESNRLAAGKLPSPAEAKGQRGRMFELQGSVVSVERVEDHRRRTALAMHRGAFRLSPPGCGLRG